jgi:hypothetical protein
MFESIKRSALFGSISLVIGAAALLAPRTGHAQPAVVGPTKPVLVVNDPAQPVPVEGAIHVENPPESPAFVRDVDDPARSRFQAGDVCLFPAGQVRCFIDLPVPSGKLLVIETISAEVFVQPGKRGRASMEVTQGANPKVYSLPLRSEGAFGLGEDFTGHHLVRLYADPGTEVRFFMDRSATPTAIVESGVATISGYLVECGVGSGCPIP